MPSCYPIRRDSRPGFRDKAARLAQIMTAMIVLLWWRAAMDLLKSFRLGRRGTPSVRLHRLDAAAKLPFPRRPPHGISLSSEARQLLREASFQFKEGSTFPRR